MGTAGWIVIGLLVLIGLWLVMTYNGLVSLRQRFRQALSDIDVQLKQRHDLVPNLVETVKGYAAHERGTLEAVIQARNAAVTAQGPAAQAQAEGMLQGALRQLFALAEAYPDLKANQNFQQLQSELSDLENKIAASRRFFNNAAAEYNATRESFPAVLFAQAMGFSPQDSLNLDEAEPNHRRPAGNSSVSYPRAGSAAPPELPAASGAPLAAAVPHRDAPEAEEVRVPMYRNRGAAGVTAGSPPVAETAAPRAPAAHAPAPSRRGSQGRRRHMRPK